ncbi:mucin-1 [Hyalella azteca]|uniref:Mucin-1 n=1 Tax=Hyalella azteca TaxID=294128 RepID=A0A8B7P665_HYAAZ|nr:mucin-1 [Hyalella azteca]
MRVEVFSACVCVLLLLVLPRAADGFSSGAGASACDSMIPQHGGLVAQTTTSPYNVTARNNGDRSITVILTAQEGIVGFKGFLLQARNAADARVGGFDNLPDGSQFLQCTDSQVKDAVTHSSAVEKRRLELTWNAPASFIGPITFRTTFVQSFMIFWTEVKSEAQQILSLSTLPPTTAQTLPPTTASPTSPLTTAPSTSPPTTAPPTSPLTTDPPTTAPPTSPLTTAPPNTAPPTSPLTTAPPTSPPTTDPPITAPPTSPLTTAPPTSPPTTDPPTSPLTTAPPTTAPPTSPLTTASPSSPLTTAPPTSPFTTTAPPTSPLTTAPPTSPLTTAPPTSPLTTAPPTSPLTTAPPTSPPSTDTLPSSSTTFPMSPPTTASTTTTPTLVPTTSQPTTDRPMSPPTSLMPSTENSTNVPPPTLPTTVPALTTAPITPPGTFTVAPPSTGYGIPPAKPNYGNNYFPSYGYGAPRSPDETYGASSLGHNYGVSAGDAFYNPPRFSEVNNAFNPPIRRDTVLSLPSHLEIDGLVPPPPHFRVSPLQFSMPDPDSKPRPYLIPRLPLLDEHSRRPFSSFMPSRELCGQTKRYPCRDEKILPSTIPLYGLADNMKTLSFFTVRHPPS